jgi:hypothetical protein
MYNALIKGSDTNSGTKGTVAKQTALITQTKAISNDHGEHTGEYIWGNNLVRNIQRDQTTRG